MSEMISRRGSLVAFVAAMLVMAAGGQFVSGRAAPDSYWNTFLWYVLPSMPFVLLAMLSPILPDRIGALWGAAIGAAVAVWVPWGLLWYSSATYSGGGANIGIGLLLMAMPVYLPFCMLAGFAIVILFGRLSSKSQQVQ